jgi:ABC-type transport system involved in Fe-S cluster assembly fused permease/ATPase subunit
MQVVNYVLKYVLDFKNQAYAQKCSQKHEDNYKGCIIVSHSSTNILNII